MGRAEMFFETTYALDAKGFEFARQSMFEHEQAFSFQDARAPKVVVDSGALGPSRLCRVHSTGHTISLEEPDFITVLMPRRGRMVVETSAGEFTARPGDMLVFTPNMRATRVIPDSSGAFQSDCVLAASRDVFGDGAARHLEFCFPPLTSDENARGLRHYVEFLFAEGGRANSTLVAECARGAANVLLSEILARLVAAQDLAEPVGKAPSQGDHRLVRLAEEVMRERYFMPLSTRDIARMLGFSARRLQIAFFNVRGCSPLAVLKAIRLEAARGRFLDPAESGTVTSIATDCGFFHLGRFSGDYARAFGETPTQSLRGVRGNRLAVVRSR